MSISRPAPEIIVMRKSQGPDFWMLYNRLPGIMMMLGLVVLLLAVLLFSAMRCVRDAVAPAPTVPVSEDVESQDNNDF